MTRQSFYLFLWLFCGAVVFGQDTGKVLDRLNAGQKKHFRIYQQIDAAQKKENITHRKIFQTFNQPIAEACRETGPKFTKQGELYQEKADQALEEGKEELAKRLQKAANLYLDMGKAQGDLVNAFERINTNATYQALSQIKHLETEMRQAKLKLPERKWLFTTEAQKILAATTRKK